ncbi:hypothetical protein XALC_2406 [Xanthomonas albilineans GPE PC73]|uniref:Uncharacterized protein n=1 Tax=Xanthomonas albilineans (strain GPE PC73 / CFBP 7063) TaxID=380358 RepID=D2U9E4_XANAP|nr:hypothetical protein XALC_2406 [Xanthomonas albilineans GPE PC73]
MRLTPGARIGKTVMRCTSAHAIDCRSFPKITLVIALSSITISDLLFKKIHPGKDRSAAMPRQNKTPPTPPPCIGTVIAIKIHKNIKNTEITSAGKNLLNLKVCGNL